MTGIETRSDYRERIETMADVVEAAVEDDPGAEVSELVFEEVDSSRMVMMTNQALDALKHADNEPGEWHHMAADTDSWQQVISTMAFCAVRFDLYDELRERGVEGV